MSATDLCAYCGGDCPYIPECEVCHGCEAIACPAHNTEPDLGPIWIGSELDDEWDDQ